MSRTTTGRAANGSGSIRKITQSHNGKNYIYWQARVTVGYDPGTGKQKQRSITGKTKKEVAERLRELTSEIDQGSYHESTKMTVAEWCNIWAASYLINVKPYTVASYKGVIKNHIKPGLGSIRLDALSPHIIQGFYNELMTKKSLGAKSVKNVHGILHRLLKQATLEGYIRTNPTDACVLPRIQHTEIRPLDEVDTKAFIAALQGHRFELLYTFTVFTGLRQGEVLGLRWDCVDFDRGIICIKQQLQRQKQQNGQYYLAPLKNDRSRTITPAPFVMDLLKRQLTQQKAWRSQAGTAWENSGFVFTDALGHHLALHTVYKDYKKVVTAIGRPDARFHDLRHSYAVASIRAGDDIKTVQGNLGHATAAFTLDVYGHVTDQMQRASADRMQHYIDDVLKLASSQ